MKALASRCKIVEMFAVWLVVELVADSETIETRVDPDRGRVFPDGSGEWVGS